MKKNSYVLLFILGLFGSCKAQQEMVDIKSGSGKLVRLFEYHSKSNIDVVNGRMNFALTSSNGYLFEISAVPVKAIKCGKALPAGNYDVVLIDNRMDRSYKLVSTSKPKTSIRCLSNGGYEITFNGDLFDGKDKIKVFARLRGTVNHSQQLKTN